MTSAPIRSKSTVSTPFPNLTTPALIVVPGAVEDGVNLVAFTESPVSKTIVSAPNESVRIRSAPTPPSIIDFWPAIEEEKWCHFPPHL